MFTILLLAFLLILTPSFAKSDSPASPLRPNVVMIVIDSLRGDHLGCYGYHRDTSPRIDKLAAEGIRLTGMVAASSWTIPSMMTIFTSVSPSIHTVHLTDRALPEDITTLALELRKGGYQTAGITSNPLAARKYGFARGFDFYDDTTVGFSAQLDMLTDDRPELRNIRNTPTSDTVTALGRKWLTETRDPAKPFFLFLFYFDPHYDYMPPPPFDTAFTDPEYGGTQNGSGITSLRGKKLSAADKEHIIALYDGEIKYTDKHIGRFLDTLETEGLSSNTAVIVTSDHGEEFWDHDGVGHGHSLYDELLLMPFILRHPGQVPAGHTINLHARHIDIMPTILAIADLPVPAQCEGISLAPAWKTPGTPPESLPTISELIRAHDISIRIPTAKIIKTRQSSQMEMYDLTTDPREKHNLAPAEDHQTLTELLERLRDWEKAHREGETTFRPATFDLDSQLLDQLRTLGYMQ